MNSKTWLPLTQQQWFELNLFKSLVQRTLTERHKGSILGSLWTFINQLALLLIYTFVFSIVLKVRNNIPGLPEGSHLTFGIWLYSGLLPWLTFARGLNESTRSVITQANLVKKVVFPLYLLPIVPICAAFVESASGLLLLIAFVVLWTQKLYPTVFLLPLIWIPQLLFTAGLGYLTAGLTVFLRDIPQAISIILSLWFYMTPILYPVSLIPQPFQTWITWINPMAVTIQIHRELILIGTISHWGQWIWIFALSVLLFMGGLWCYEKLRSAFADVL